MGKGLQHQAWSLGYDARARIMKTLVGHAMPIIPVYLEVHSTQ